MPLYFQAHSVLSNAVVNVYSPNGVAGGGVGVMLTRIEGEPPVTHTFVVFPVDDKYINADVVVSVVLDDVHDLCL